MTTNVTEFAKTGASVNVTWSTSRGADNYTIEVIPPVMSGQSDFTTTATSLQLTLVYNVNYSVNITAQNCAWRNSTVVPLIVGKVMVCHVQLCVISYSYMACMNQSLS